MTAEEEHDAAIRANERARWVAVFLLWQRRIEERYGRGNPLFSGEAAAYGFAAAALAADDKIPWGDEILCG